MGWVVERVCVTCGWIPRSVATAVRRWSHWVEGVTPRRGCGSGMPTPRRPFGALAVGRATTGELMGIELCNLRKDGGPESRVWGYFLIANKRLFSVVLLRFEDGSREAFHSHAFNCLSWVLQGHLTEHHLDGRVQQHPASLLPFVTRRDTFHQVSSDGRTWVLSFRGPWARTWMEYIPASDETLTLTWGRKPLRVA